MNKSILIIGAGPGIGFAVAEKFGRAGWCTVLAARDAERLQAHVAALKANGFDAHAIRADARNARSLRDAIDEAERLTGGLGVVHYNAAVVRRQDLFSMSDSDIVDDLLVNVAGGMFAIREAAALLRSRGGSIVVTGGGLAISPHRDWASLGAAKAALRNIVGALHAPLRDQGIRLGLLTVATLVSPGSVEAREVADGLWSLATDPTSTWEAAYPSADTA